ncbi:MAG TPA: 16S rRNA (adenine(1518)-N(6)/adenine(1519)-N(6))-dimethyltransferase RsmA [Burkholderiales bacterium]|jgi:16S rRNA (adenine1518-N6/adenine1519-N6)-dimethyltransferase|nr:16S rRNA (adenine(1518)-N(6)/adenine(1519)-N(6))-dimethyltransferase RsmA [Burkholderiales bacterium]
MSAPGLAPSSVLPHPPHRPRRRFSQNFLVDRDVVRRIVEAIDPRPGDTVVEIGPGLGALTTPLLERLPVLHAVEIDRDVAASLFQRFSPEKLRLHVGDALAFDFSSLGEALRVVGNLPYHICTPLLFRIDRLHAGVRDCHFMLQKEVVERMAARPGSPQYGRLSVMLQYRWGITSLFDVPPEAFRPRPKVWSSVVRLVPHAQLPCRAVDEAMLARLVGAAFAQRRKTLRNALRALLDEKAIAGCGVDPRLRAETLEVVQFVRLADAAAAQISASSG